MSCPLCTRRKARRQCPALGKQICAVCCGTKRLSEIRCPPDCGYLSASRAHPPAVVQRQQQRDLTVLLPQLQGLSQPQSRLMLLIGSLIARHTPQDLQTLRDADIADAAGTVAATLETSRRGLIYEHRPTTQAAQHLADDLKRMLAELGQDPRALDPQAGAGPSGGTPPAAERVAPSRLEHDAAVALRRIEQGARDALSPPARPTGPMGPMSPMSNHEASEAGDRHSRYRDLLVRVLKSTPPGADEAPRAPAPTSNIIIP